MGIGETLIPVSVIVPCYNAERFLSDLLRSLQAQTEPADEVVVVESHSTDRSMDILRSFRRSLPLRIEQRPKEGIYPAWNEGVRLASHELCFIACADDIMYPNLLRQLRELRRASPDAELYSWRVDAVDRRGEIIVPGGTPILDLLWGDWTRRPHRRSGVADALTALTIGSPYLSMMGVAFTRSLWKATGGFPSQYGSAGDVAWQVQAGLRSAVASAPGALAAWRVHDTGATSLSRGEEEFTNLRKVVDDALPVVREHLGVAHQRLENRLKQLAQQARALTLMTRLKPWPSRKGLALLRAQSHLPGIASLAFQLLWARIARRRPGSLAIPAHKLRRLFSELNVHDPEDLCLDHVWSGRAPS